jgi:hypothetical protein
MDPTNHDRLALASPVPDAGSDIGDASGLRDRRLDRSPLQLN